MNATAQQISDSISTMILQPITSLLFAVGFLVFIWGLIEFIANPTDPEKKKTGTNHMIFGILGLLIMVSIWGIVGLITNTLGVDCSGLSQGQPCR